jgi:hypothetical protein
MSGESNDYWNEEQMLSTSALNLYSFVPFTDEEWKEMSFVYKLEQRQIPEAFLHKMSTKELFYQYVYCDLSKSVLVFNTIQQGFENTKPLNMLPELLNRPDAGHVLLDLLQKVDPAKIKSPDCHWFYLCLNMIGAQPEIINRMTDEDIDNYIEQQMRCHNTIKHLSAIDENWEYPASVKTLLFGLGNVMIRYEYDTFVQTLGRHPDTNELIWNTQYMTEQDVAQVIDGVKQFKNRKK